MRTKRANFLKYQHKKKKTTKRQKTTYDSNEETAIYV